MPPLASQPCAFSCFPSLETIHQRHNHTTHTTNNTNNKQKKGFDLGENDGITLVKQVKYRGQVIEAAWPLGAAIDDLSAPA